MFLSDLGKYPKRLKKYQVADSQCKVNGRTSQQALKEKSGGVGFGQKNKLVLQHLQGYIFSKQYCWKCKMPGCEFTGTPY